MKLIDLSQTLSATMPMFSPSAPHPSIEPWLSHEQALESGNYEGCSCEITEVNFLTSASTYLDSPYHFHPDRRQIHELALEQLVLPGIVIDCTQIGRRQPIEPDVLAGVDLAGKAILFHTGWSNKWGDGDYADGPFLTGDTAHALVDGGAKLAGVDFLVIDDTSNPHRPVHVTLLKHDILIVENLTNLAELPGSDFIFHAVPVKVQGAAAFPVRAYAAIMTTV